MKRKLLITPENERTQLAIITKELSTNQIDTIELSYKESDTEEKCLNCRKILKVSWTEKRMGAIDTVYNGVPINMFPSYNSKHNGCYYLGFLCDKCIQDLHDRQITRLVWQHENE